MLRRLIVHVSHYSTGSLLVTAASFVSFPIFTRTFSVEEYGALNLIASLLLFWTGIGKLGMQHSIARFHAEVVAGKRAVDESGYLSTVLVGMAMTGVAVAAGWALATLAIPPAWWHNEHVARLIFPVSALIVVRVMDSALNNVLRAQQRSVTYNTYIVARKYVSLAAILLLIFYVLPGLPGFYVGTFMAEGAAVLVLLFHLVRRHGLAIRKFSPQTFRAMLAFGVPLIAYELSGVILILGDRYVIQVLAGSEALGLYSAAYNLCEYLQIVLFLSFATAITPIYVRMWEEQGEGPTVQFIEKALRLYFMIGLAVLAGMIAVGEPILIVLASQKYAAGAIVIPWVIIALLIDASTPMFGAGMYIAKQNHRIIPFVVGAAVLNIALNFLLIPKVGILGAGIATVLSYIVVAVSAWTIGQKYVHIHFPYLDVLKFGVLAAIMLGAVMLVNLPNLWLNLGAKIATGVVVYSTLVLLFDRTARTALLEAKARFAGAD
jgi:O-antigen/teichoic acid export membrane protein